MQVYGERRLEGDSEAQAPTATVACAKVEQRLGQVQ